MASDLQPGRKRFSARTVARDGYALVASVFDCPVHKYAGNPPSGLRWLSPQIG